MRNFWLSLLLALTTFSLSAQDFMMQGWYWDYPMVKDGKRFAEYLSTRVDDIAAGGFNYVWLMPISQGSGGIYSVGYDVQDYYNLGDHGWNRYGRRQHLNLLLDSLADANINTVADVIYNHRDGGLPEVNPALKNYQLGLTYQDIDNGTNPFPSDRYRLALPIGGATGNDAGDYYFKVRSITQHPRFHNKAYYFEMWTQRKGPTGGGVINESEPNGGSDCNEDFDETSVGRVVKATVDAGGCAIDEFKISLDTTDYFQEGDTLYITLRTGGSPGFGDHADLYIHGLWAGPRNADISDEILYQTYTDFTQMPSDKGEMDWRNFKPNGNPTSLSGDWDGMWFYYDVDQSVQDTRQVFYDFTKWLWTDVDIRGYRMDAVKHFPPAFTGDLMDYLHDEGINPGMVVGEFFDGNPGTLKWWIDAVDGAMDQDTKDSIDVRAFDFALRSSLKQACDAFGYDVRNVFNSGMVDGAGASGFDVVTFLNNHDFRHPGEAIENDPVLGYAYILTNNQLGVPCVFYPDYFDDPQRAGYIKGLIEAHKKYIYGATNRYYLNNFNSGYGSNFFEGSTNTALLYQLSNAVSNREVVVAINFSGETMKVDQHVDMSNLAEGDTLTDILGLSNFPYALVKNSQIYMELPPRSFSVWVEGDLQNELISTEPPFELVSGITEKTGGQTGELELQTNPNPFESNFYVNVVSDDFINGRMTVYALSGKKMFQSNKITTQTTLNIDGSQWPAGMYWVEINSDQGRISKPVIKMQ